MIYQWIYYILSVDSRGKGSYADVDTSSFSVIIKSATYGLWKYCVSDTCATYQDGCTVLRGGCSKMLTTRAFITMVCIVIPFVIGCFLYVIIKKQFESGILVIGKIVTWLSFSIGLIGMAVDINYFHTQNPWYMGVASIISAVAVFLNLVAACFAFFIGVKISC